MHLIEEGMKIYSLWKLFISIKKLIWHFDFLSTRIVIPFDNPFFKLTPRNGLVKNENKDAYLGRYIDVGDRHLRRFMSVTIFRWWNVMKVTNITVASTTSKFWYDLIEISNWDSQCSQTNQGPLSLSGATKFGFQSLSLTPRPLI